MLNQISFCLLNLFNELYKKNLMIDLTEIKRLINFIGRLKLVEFFFGKLTKYIRINENIEDAIELISIDNEEFISIFTKKWRIL